MQFLYEGRAIEISSPKLLLGGQSAKVLFNTLDFLKDVFEEINKHFQQGQRYYCKASLPKELFDSVADNIKKLEAAYPFSLAPVFHDPDALEDIVANAWVAADIPGGKRADALIRMSFAKGTDNLPLHIHEYSDRVLIIERGVGYGYYATGSPDNFKESHIRRIPIRAGDIIAFPKNTMHTFQSTVEAITTITYHSPYIDFADEQSFEKIIGGVDGGWYPAMFKPD